jgi:SAM-dependent methyltransferase
MIIWYILLVIISLVILTELFSVCTGVPTVASARASRRTMTEILKKRSASAGSNVFNIVDLGSGNGQLAARIAREIPKAKVTGIEISIVPWGISFLRQKIFGPENVEFRRQSFWNYDCSQADAVTVYLIGKVMERVSEKLQKELKPGAMVLSNEIPLRGDWQPVEVIETGFLGMKIFVYRQG